MGQSQKQPKVTLPLRKLQLVPANPLFHALILALSPPALQPASQSVHASSNNKSRNNNQSYLFVFALKEKYAEYIQAEVMFLSDINNNNVYFFVLQY